MCFLFLKFLYHLKQQSFRIKEYFFPAGETFHLVDRRINECSTQLRILCKAILLRLAFIFGNE